MCKIPQNNNIKIALTAVIFFLGMAEFANFTNLSYRREFQSFPAITAIAANMTISS